MHRKSAVSQPPPSSRPSLWFCDKIFTRARERLHSSSSVLGAQPEHPPPVRVARLDHRRRFGRVPRAIVAEQRQHAHAAHAAARAAGQRLGVAREADRADGLGEERVVDGLF